MRRPSGSASVDCSTSMVTSTSAGIGEQAIVSVYIHYYRHETVL